MAKTAELSQNMSVHKLFNSPAFYSKQSDILLSTYGITPEDPWYVLLVRRKSDFKVSSQPEARGFTHMLPTRALEKQWSDRRVTAQVPLFPGYIFCQFNTSQREILLSTPGVSSVISFGDNFALVGQRDIDSIKQLIKHKLSSTHHSDTILCSKGHNYRSNH